MHDYYISMLRVHAACACYLTRPRRDRTRTVPYDMLKIYLARAMGRIQAAEIESQTETEIETEIGEMSDIGEMAAPSGRGQARGRRPARARR